MRSRGDLRKRLEALERALAPPFDAAEWSRQMIRRMWRLDSFTAEELELFERLWERDPRSRRESWETWRALCRDDAELATLEGLRARDEHAGDNLMDYLMNMHL